MNFGELRTELLARGFDYLDSAQHTRPNRYINRAYHAICDTYDWPFLEADAQGVAPLTISDLRSVLGIVNSSQMVKLRYVDRRRLLDIDPDLTTAGSPVLWYQTSPTQIKVYPASATDQISVHYIKTPADLSADADVPLIPARFHLLIVDQAVVYAYEDSDNLDAAAGAQTTLDRRLEEMRGSLLHPNLDTHDFIVSTVDHQEWP
jgi:hypothetical protein